MLKTIKGHCKTNLDNWDVSKVIEFARVPNMGERISAYNRAGESTLKVVQITHDFRNGEPYIIVELHN